MDNNSDKYSDEYSDKYDNKNLGDGVYYDIFSNKLVGVPSEKDMDFCLKVYRFNRRNIITRRPTLNYYRIRTLAINKTTDMYPQCYDVFRSMRSHNDSSDEKS